MAQFGYDHKNSGETLYLKYPFKNYYKLVSKVTGQEDTKSPLIIKLDHTKSIYGMKYGAKFQNIFFYRLNSPLPNKNQNGISSPPLLQLLNFNFYISQKSKMIKLVNFDVSPVWKISMNNVSTKFPFNVYFKFGKYEASRVQHFDSKDSNMYDISKVLKSMLPYYRTGLGISHTSDFSLFLKKKRFDFNAKYILAFNRIHKYEDNIKLTTNLRMHFDIYEELNKLFRIQVSNDFSIKKSFILPHKNQKYENGEDASFKKVCKNVKDSHVLSGYECHSKILEMNLLNYDNIIDNGSDFYLQNNLTLRLKDIPLLKDNEILGRINPYFALETIFLPAYHKGKNKTNLGEIKNNLDFKNSFRFIYTLGFAIAVNDYMNINFALYTAASDNIKIKKEFLNKFRITLSL